MLIVFSGKVNVSLFDKNIRSSFFVCMNESRQRETPGWRKSKIGPIVEERGRKHENKH